MWAAFERLSAPDPDTHTTLAPVMTATLQAGQRVAVTINNKAGGSAPASVQAPAQALAAWMPAAPPGALAQAVPAVPRQASGAL